MDGFQNCTSVGRARSIAPPPRASFSCRRQSRFARHTRPGGNSYVRVIPAQAGIQTSASFPPGGIDTCELVIPAQAGIQTRAVIPLRRRESRLPRHPPAQAGIQFRVIPAQAGIQTSASFPRRRERGTLISQIPACAGMTEEPPCRRERNALTSRFAPAGNRRD